MDLVVRSRADAVLLDYMLPDMTGADVAIALGADPTVVLLDGCIRRSDVIKGVGHESSSFGVGSGNVRYRGPVTSDTRWRHGPLRVSQLQPEWRRTDPRTLDRLSRRDDQHDGRSSDSDLHRLRSSPYQHLYVRAEQRDAKQPRGAECVNFRHRKCRRPQLHVHGPIQGSAIGNGQHLGDFTSYAVLGSFAGSVFTPFTLGGTYDLILGFNDGMRVDSDYDDLVVGLQVTAIPELQTYASLLAGLGVVGFMAKRRRVS